MINYFDSCRKKNTIYIPILEYRHNIIGYVSKKLVFPDDNALGNLKTLIIVNDIKFIKWVSWKCVSSQLLEIYTKIYTRELIKSKMYACYTVITIDNNKIVTSESEFWTMTKPRQHNIIIYVIQLKVHVGSSQILCVIMWKIRPRWLRLFLK